jgi:hypothetical protein
MEVQIKKLREIRQMGTALIHEDGRTNGHDEVIGALRDYANAPHNGTSN